MHGGGVRELRSVCPYCGVGCGVLATVRSGRVAAVRGDPDHPTNRGGLCAKGQSLLGTLRPGDRLLHPALRAVDPATGAFDRMSSPARTTWDRALGEGAQRIRAIQQRHGPDAVAFYLSGQLLTEDYYVANKLVKGFLRTNNVDTNSRLCMASASVAYKLTFGSDAPPGCYDDADDATCVLLIGSNAAETHPIVFGRLLEARRRTGARWIVVDPRRTATAEAADLHLQLRPGSDVTLLLAMLETCIAERLVDARFVRLHTSGFDEAAAVAAEWPAERAAAVCDLDADDIRRAARLFGSAAGALSLWCQGLNQASTATDRNLALLNLHLATGQIARPGAGPFSLTGQANAMGGREVGGLATELAAHHRLDDARDRTAVAEFWGGGPIATQPGLTAVEMVDALLDGRLRALWIAGSNPIASLPDAARAEAALRAAELLVVQDLYPTETSQLADIVLPAAGWGEKTGTLTSSERRVALAERLVAPAGEALPDWQIFARLAGHVGCGAAFAYRDSADVFDEHVALTAGRTCDMSGLSHAILRTRGSVQWPCPPGASGTQRRYIDARFATPDGRARFHPTPCRAPAEEPCGALPLRLTTHRLAATWHTQTKTGRIAELRRAQPLRLEVHPADAAAVGLGDDDACELQSRRGQWRGLVRVTDRVSRGTVALPFHGAPAYTRGGWVNRLTMAALDPRSRQPELKHAAVRLSRARPRLEGVTLIAARGDRRVDDLVAALAEAGAGAIDIAWCDEDRAPDGRWLALTGTSEVRDWLHRAGIPVPVKVDAGAHLCSRDGAWAVGPDVRTVGGLPLTEDARRLGWAIARDGADGVRALARAELDTSARPRRPACRDVRCRGLRARPPGALAPGRRASPGRRRRRARRDCRHDRARLDGRPRAFGGPHRVPARGRVTDGRPMPTAGALCVPSVVGGSGVA
jgi:anaerobic selenocysteine-containing dehydrogenase